MFRNEDKHISSITQGEILFSSSLSGDLESPSYQITLSDGSSREVFRDENGHKFYLIPRRLVLDDMTQMLKENEVQMHPIYLP